MNAEDFVSRLQHVNNTPSGWTAKCPAHDDHHNSLSVGEGQNGRVLVKCFAGCAPKAVVKAMGLEMADLFQDSRMSRTGTRKRAGKIAATYDFVDESGRLLYQEVRFEPKDFRLRRPDGNGGWVWHLACHERCTCKRKLAPVRHVLYNLPAVRNAKLVLVVEGPKDCEAARKLGLVATTNAMGANARWRQEYSDALRGKSVCLIADADALGLAHTKDAARWLVGVAQCVKLIEALPGVPYKGDLTDYVQAGGTRESLLKLIDEAPQLTAADVPKLAPPKTRTVWEEAAFVSEEEDGASIEFLEPPVLATGHLTLLSGPRGLGKSNYAAWLAVKMARAGKRVLYLDRDNPPRKARQNIRMWGGTGIVKLLTRDKVPALLGNEAEWKAFPVKDYDVVIIDSWDSTAEGIGEKDSRLPSIAISRILDIVHAENGPGVLVLMNTVRAGTHSRCSGVVEDRADAVFEVRDLTSMQFSGQKPWWEEIPIVGAKDWAGRATRRKDKERLRIGLVPSKWKVDGPEPSAFALELDFTTSPFSVRDVTDQIDAEGAEARKRTAEERAEAVQKAVDMLAAEIQRRSYAGEPDILTKQAEQFLTIQKISQKIARETLKSSRFEMVDIDGRGHPKAVRLRSKILGRNRNTIVTETVKKGRVDGVDFGGLVSMHPTKIDPSRPLENRGAGKKVNSDDSSLFPPNGGWRAKFLQILRQKSCDPDYSEETWDKVRVR